jgi:hypothetical protein
MQKKWMRTKNLTPGGRIKTDSAVFACFANAEQQRIRQPCNGQQMLIGNVQSFRSS